MTIALGGATTTSELSSKNVTIAIEKSSSADTSPSKQIPKWRQRAKSNSPPSRRRRSGVGTDTSDHSSHHHHHHHYPKEFLQGLTIAGVGASLLATIFSLFHIDVFLRVFELPLATYATGNLIYGIVNTANDVMGAWLVDLTAAKGGRRSGWIGIGGCFLALCFLLPFFQWTRHQGLHFCVSMCCYDSLYSFTAILMGSVVTDNSIMGDKERVSFMASGKLVNLLASFVVARMGLAFFETNDLARFQLFLLVLALVVCLLFVIGQAIMDVSLQQHSSSQSSMHHSRQIFHHHNHDVKSKRSTLKLRRVIQDFCNHRNFRAWIVMEMLLECQLAFVSSFMKTFVDRLVLGDTFSRDFCDIVLSLVRPLSQVMGILCYIPIRHRGYPTVYMWLFYFNFCISLGCLLIADPSSSPTTVLLFLLVYSLLTGAVQSAGFHLAMSDMVMELKIKHLTEQRSDEPSLAGLFMGANALICKPMESFLPIIAAIVLDETDFQDGQLQGANAMLIPPNEQSATDDNVHWVLFYLLVGPPLLFSGLQMLAWRHYTLQPKKTGQLREELKQLIGYGGADLDDDSGVI